MDSVSRAYPEILIIMLLDQPDRESVISAFRCGARGVFSRRQDISEFIDCIEHVRKGGIWAGSWLRITCWKPLKAFQLQTCSVPEHLLH